MDFTKTVIPLALMASKSMAIRPSASLATVPEPIWARGIIVKYLSLVGLLGVSLEITGDNGSQVRIFDRPTVG